MITSDILLMPHEKGFQETLGWNIPYGCPPESNFIVRADGSGILEPATYKETQDYLNGGEYDQRMSEIEDDTQIIDIDFYITL
jgi:hypothetical protein